ncbi:Dihydroorotate dehydrogenase [Bienertia sinuspersici]
MRLGGETNLRQLMHDTYAQRDDIPNLSENMDEAIGLKWKDYKCCLKGIYYDDDISINIVQDRCPSDVEKDQWITLVNFWRSEEGKRSKRGKESPMNAKVKPISTTGTKSHAREKELKKSMTLTQIYLACHTHDNEAEIMNQIKIIVAEQGDK